jgi:hypothetical protein
VREQPAPVCHQRAQQVELDRGQVDLFPVAADGVRGDVELEPVDSQHRFVACGSRSAQRRLQPRHELTRAERLGHVVVGAGLESAHLLLLLTDRRQDEDRHRRPLAQVASDLDAVAVGQHQVEDRGVRRAHGGGVERLRGGGRRDDLEAGLAQHDAQGAQDLRLVVADEHAGAGLAHAAVVAR